MAFSVWMAASCLLLLLGLSHLLQGVDCFRIIQPLKFSSAGAVGVVGIRSALWMGLYDTPLPPRPSPSGGSGGEEEEEEAEDEEEGFLPVTTQQRLFSMQDDGTEAQELLPRLGRRLDLGIGCYFEVSDSKVLNLSKLASCNPKDAAWALEATKGDMTEARTLISVAQRKLLESIQTQMRRTNDKEADERENDDAIFMEKLQDAANQKAMAKKQQQKQSGSYFQKAMAKKQQQEQARSEKDDNTDDDDDDDSTEGSLNLDNVKSDLYDMLREDEWEEMAEKRKKEREYQKRMEKFKSAGADAPWLPTQNPRPIDDEPWFTG